MSKHTARRRSDYVIAGLLLAAVLVLVVGAVTVWRHVDGDPPRPAPTAPEADVPTAEVPEVPPPTPDPAAATTYVDVTEYEAPVGTVGPDFAYCLPDGATMYTDGTYEYVDGPHCWPQDLAYGDMPAMTGCDYPVWRMEFDPYGELCGYGQEKTMPPTYMPPQPAVTSPLESDCSDPAWRQANHPQDDALCGSEWDGTY